MKTLNFMEDGADAAIEPVRGGEHEEPLFGDAVWIEERLNALRTNDASPSQIPIAS